MVFSHLITFSVCFGSFAYVTKIFLLLFLNFGLCICNTCLIFTRDPYSRKLNWWRRLLVKNNSYSFLEWIWALTGRNLLVKNRVVTVYYILYELLLRFYLGWWVISPQKLSYNIKYLLNYCLILYIPELKVQNIFIHITKVKYLFLHEVKVGI